MGLLRSECPVRSYHFLETILNRVVLGKEGAPLKFISIVVAARHQRLYMGY